ncbi:MAG: helix-turn-helix transcriptional regulator [Actinomycetota bacterium]|nr:helix-turn-helix transcriptional regulator [Actinomycetota bacterium]
MRRCYGRYCPVSHALDLVGERWALLIVTELMQGPQRYSDLASTLGVGTNILAARLRELEAAGIVSKRRLPPPAASQVYELTEYGVQLKPVLRELAHWGARSLGPPGPDADLFPGWLENAVRIGLETPPAEGKFEFRIGDEVVALADGEIVGGGVDDPDVIVEGDPAGFFHLLVNGDPTGLTFSGESTAVERLLGGSRAPLFA